MSKVYPFTEEDSQAAFDEWGANCGPNALAFALRRNIRELRGVIPGFEEKRYTSPSMMKAALAKLGVPFKVCDIESQAGIPSMFGKDAVALTRIQWTGPWTAPGANPKWAYRQTHWITTWSTHKELPPLMGEYRQTQVGLWVFDCNGGARSFRSWRDEIVPLLTASINRADGGWHPTHIWRLSK